VSIGSLRRLLKNSRMPRCCQFSEDRKEPSAGLIGLRGPHLPASRSAWRHREGRKVAPPWWEERVPPFSGRELFGAPWKGEGPLPLMGVAPQLQPFGGMLLRRSTDIYSKELARDMREFFNSLLDASSVAIASHRGFKSSSSSAISGCFIKLDGAS
jgi:hypothetical protein